MAALTPAVGGTAVVPVLLVTVYGDSHLEPVIFVVRDIGLVCHVHIADWDGRRMAVL